MLFVSDILCVDLAAAEPLPEAKSAGGYAFVVCVCVCRLVRSTVATDIFSLVFPSGGSRMSPVMTAQTLLKPSSKFG